MVCISKWIPGEKTLGKEDKKKYLIQIFGAENGKPLS